MIGLSTYAARLAERPRRQHRLLAKQPERIAALASWIGSCYYGVSRADIREKFPEFYDQDACADTYIQIGRDLRTLGRVLPGAFYIPQRWPPNGSGRVLRLKSLTFGGEPITAKQSDGSANIILTEPAKCPLCKSMRCFIVNRNGRALCVYCDGKVQSGKIQYDR